MTRYLPNSPQGAPNFTDKQKSIGTLLGIRVFDSQNDLRQILQAETAAKKLGIRAIDSQNDIRQIREYLGNNPTPTAAPTPTATPPPPAPDPQDPKPEEPKPFDFGSALSDLSANFAAQISAQEAAYAQSMQGLEDRLKELQNRPSANPNERNRVMGVRFAGQHNRLRRAGNIFKRSGGRIQGIKSNAINI
tara:strand:- start:135 stop:707 length:573 start_codon:yes stop_codon:yes gene_type:complete